MKKLVIIFVLLAGKLLAQTQPSQPLLFRTVTGIVKNREGDVLSGCKVELKIGDDTLLTITDTAGRFNFENVKSGRFFIKVNSPGYYPLVFSYTGDAKLKQIILEAPRLSPLIPMIKVEYGKNWNIGDKIDAPGRDDIFHQALVLAFNNKRDSLKVHYLDVSYPDAWVDKKITRPYNLQFKADSAAAAKGLRPGRYVMYIYHNHMGIPQGYFIINEDGNYEYFFENSNTKPALYRVPYLKASGKGEYSFNKTTGIVKWLSGPFLNLDGTAHLSTSIEGQAYVIQSLSSDGLSGTYYSKR